VESQRPKFGNFPAGLFQSSTTVSPDFLSNKNHQEYSTRLAKDGMPFLYNLVYCVIGQPLEQEKLQDKAPQGQSNSNSDNVKHDNSKRLELEGLAYGKSVNPPLGHRADKVSFLFMLSQISFKL
jgi:hypothetical protein